MATNNTQQLRADNNVARKFSTAFQLAVGDCRVPDGAGGVPCLQRFRLCEWLSIAVDGGWLAR